MIELTKTLFITAGMKRRNNLIVIAGPEVDGLQNQLSKLMFVAQNQIQVGAASSG
jgi:hypothetical protein